MEEKETGKTEELANFILVRLHQAEKENVILKAKGKFSVQQANYTMKRFAEDLGSWVIKEVIRK